MKKFLLFFIFSIFLIGVISACGSDCPLEKTLVAGKIYDQATGKKIKNADVEVICHGEGGDVSQSTTSGNNGRYRVLFSQDDCDYGNSVTINAQKDGLIGTSTGTINKHLGKHCLDLDIGIINVPLVPEFGVIVGTMTILSALGVFFLVRRS